MLRMVRLRRLVAVCGCFASSELVPGSITEVPAMVGDTLSRVGSSMLSLPQRVWELTVTLVTGGERSG